MHIRSGSQAFGIVWFLVVSLASVAVGAEAPRPIPAGAPLSAAAPGFHATEATRTQQGLDLPEPTVTATGRATIYNGDIAGARERAVQAALLRALERYAGLRIEASTLISKGELIDRQVRAHTYGYVQSFEVTGENIQGTELAVQVEATVAETPVEESFRRLISETTTALFVHETNLNQAPSGRIVGAILADPFFGTELVVPATGSVETLTGKLGTAFFTDPDPATVKELGLRLMAGLVVVANVQTRQLESENIGYAVDPSVLRPVVAAEGTITIFSGQTGSVIATRRFDDVRGSDASDVERAGLEALNLLGDQMREFVIERLSEHVAEVGYTLRVVVRGEAAKDGARRVVQILESTRWVQGVELESTAPGQAVLRALCREKPLYVYEELRQVTELRVVRFDAETGAIVVEAR